jgi:hypothetical protein
MYHVFVDWHLLLLYIFYRLCRYYDGPPMLSYRSRERSRSYDREGPHLFLHLCY